MPDALHPVLTATASIGAAPPIDAVFYSVNSKKKS
jgi:hypothetical protein